MRALGWGLGLLGAAIMIVGVALALRPVLGMYSNALSDPLQDPAIKESAVPTAMRTGLIVASCGVPVSILGVFFRVRAALAGRGARPR
jgi:hypothetical protein